MKSVSILHHQRFARREEALGPSSSFRNILFMLLLCLFLGPSTAWAQLGPIKKIPSNGKTPTVVFAPRETTDATLIIRFHVGAFEDGLDSGLTRFAQHAMIESGSGVDGIQFHRDLYQAGATLRLQTGVRQATFTLTAPKRSFDALAKKMIRLVLKPKLKKARIERARRMTLNDQIDFGSASDLLSFVAGSILFPEGGDGTNEYTNRPYGDPQSIRDITPAKVFAYVRLKMTPANATVVVTGAFQQKKMQAALAGLQKGKRRAPQRPEISVALPLKSQYFALREIRVQVQVLDLKTVQDMAAARLLTAILDERVMWRLRKQGITYTAGAALVLKEWMDALVMVVPVSDSSLVPVPPALRKLLNDFVAGKSEESIWVPKNAGHEGNEFERNRAYVLATLRAKSQSSLLLADALVDDADSAVPYFSDAVFDAVKTMSEQAFMQKVRPWVQENRTIHVVFGRHIKRRGRR